MWTFLGRCAFVEIRACVFGYIAEKRKYRRTSSFSLDCSLKKNIRRLSCIYIERSSNKNYGECIISYRQLIGEGRYESSMTCFCTPPTILLLYLNYKCHSETPEAMILIDSVSVDRARQQGTLDFLEKKSVSVTFPAIFLHLYRSGASQD